MKTPFGHPCTVDAEDLSIEPFKETQRVRNFESGSKPLDDFLNTEEVEEYENDGLGSTYLVYNRGEPIAYFTVCTDSLRSEYVQERKTQGYNKNRIFKTETIPSLKIGRIAVHHDWQNRGVGRFLIRYIAGMAFEIRKTTAIRLLVVRSKPEAIPFYEKCGFVITKETKRERNRKDGTRTMYLDLESIADEV